MRATRSCMVNFNALFPRLPIRAKLVVAFGLFGVLPVVLVGGYGAFHSFTLLNQAVTERLRSGVALKADELQRLTGDVERDARFLSQLPTLRALVELPSGAEAERRRLVARLGEEFLAFSRLHPTYYQVRYLDGGGREIVRADFDGTHHRLVPAEELQDKSDRYYFWEALAAPPGTVYVSPMDLNIERGAVEVPHRPVVRYAVGLHSARGEAQGIVILNLFAASILNHVMDLGRESGNVALASSGGFYLSRSAWGRGASGESGSRFPAWLAFHAERAPAPDRGGPSPEERLSADHAPEVLEAILSGRAGAVAEPGIDGRIVAFAPVFPRPDRLGEFWVLLHAYEKTAVLSSIRSLRMLVILLGGGVLGAAIVLGLAAARHFTRPIGALIDGAEAVAAGRYDAPVVVPTNDELEDLGRHFSQMAERLRGHERELSEARDRAERKAREAEALNRIGMEVLALLSLPQIFQLVADKTRELLEADVAVLCVETPPHGLRVGAVSGARGALRLAPGDPLPASACEGGVLAGACYAATESGTVPTHWAVSMRSGERVVGSLCVAFFRPRPDRGEDRASLAGLANLATIAIENARLHREVRELTRLEERERIGQDLHDGIIQSIYAAGLGLEECARAAEEGPAGVRDRLEEVIDGLNLVIRDVRNYIVGLTPERLQGRDLGGALRELARGLSLNRLLDLELSVAPEVDGVLEPDQVGQLYHVLREALTNVVRHARASRVVLRVGCEDGVLRVMLQDDGVGFESARGEGQGLRNMRQRARRLGGDLSIESTPGRGTRIAVAVPVRAAR